MDISLGLSLAAFLAILLLFIGVDRWMSGQTRTIESRLDRYASRAGVPVEALESARRESNLASGLNRAITARSASQQIARDLARADIKLTPSEYVLVNFAVVLIGFLIVLFVSRNNIVLSLIGAVVGFYLPRFYLRRLQARRLGAFNDQLGDTLVLLSNSLRSGYSLLQSIETVSKELNQPMSTEFARVVREIGLGLTIEEALAHLVDRMSSEDLDLVVTAINIQHEVGGNLAEILDAIGHTIRERVRIKGQIRALTASQRLSGNVIAVMPIAVGIFLTLSNPDYISSMWKETCGLIMLGIGATTIVSGYLAIRKITDIEI